MLGDRMPLSSSSSRGLLVPAFVLLWLVIASTILLDNVDAFSAAITSRVGVVSTTPVIADELETDHVQRVNDIVSAALGDDASSKLDRYAGARALTDNLQANSPSSRDDDNTSTTTPRHELVYGELSIPVLATLLDAVGVLPGDRFLDIGSGDGALVLGAGLLFPDHIGQSRGVELVPGLVTRSQQHLTNLERLLSEQPNDAVMPSASIVGRMEFMVGNVYEPTTALRTVLEDSTLVVCFATTWSLGNNQQNESTSKTSLGGRRLAKLSAALTALPRHARVVIVDGKLDEADGFRWQGDLKVYCPDTAPYSVASLYSKC